MSTIKLTNGAQIDGTSIRVKKIDTSRFLGSVTKTYTATEDCYVWCEMTAGQASCYVNIDGLNVFLTSQINSYGSHENAWFYLKKGQVITLSDSGATIKIFGLL